MIGIDVSCWQNGLSLEKNKEYLDFIIMKATEGVGFVDKCLSNFAVQSTELGLLQGCYHFARPDLHGTVDTMEDEAEWFVNTVEKNGLLGKAILVLDWETEPINREDLILAWLGKVLQLTGIKPFIYGSKSMLSSNTFKNLLNNWPIWMAAWPSTNFRTIETAKSWVKNYSPTRTTVPWVIWQFSNTGILRGAGMHVDLNWTDMTPTDWMRLTGYEYIGSETGKEIITDDMQWAIDMGIFNGKGDGTYGVKDVLTKEQIATVLRRYYNAIAADFS